MLDFYFSFPESGRTSIASDISVGDEVSAHVLATLFIVNYDFYFSLYHIDSHEGDTFWLFRKYD